eukprot:1552494-Rhodomonas_salina.1
MDVKGVCNPFVTMAFCGIACGVGRESGTKSNVQLSKSVPGTSRYPGTRVGIPPVSRIQDRIP